MAISRTVNSLYGPQENQSSFMRIRWRKMAPRRQYVAKVEVERSELELPCQVQLFLKGAMAGTFTLLDMPRQGKSYDEIPLNRGVDAAGLRDRSVSEVLGGIEDELEVVISKVSITVAIISFSYDAQSQEDHVRLTNF